jgi:hypothetical protein
MQLEDTLVIGIPTAFIYVGSMLMLVFGAIYF